MRSDKLWLREMEKFSHVSYESIRAGVKDGAFDKNKVEFSVYRPRDKPAKFSKKKKKKLASLQAQRVNLCDIWPMRISRLAVTAIETTQTRFQTRVAVTIKKKKKRKVHFRSE